MKKIVFLLTLGVILHASAVGSTAISSEEIRQVAKTALEQEIQQHLHFPGSSRNQQEAVVFVELRILDGGEVEAVHINAVDRRTRELIAQQVSEMHVDDSLSTGHETFAFCVRFVDR